jgi:hypothetical protein
MSDQIEQQGACSKSGDVTERIHHINDLIEEVEEELLELIEIEDHACSCKWKPKAKKYAYKVGKTRIVVDNPIISGRHILESASKNPPEKYILRQVEHGGILKVIELNDEVDLRAPGVERFRAMPRTASDG